MSGLGARCRSHPSAIAGWRCNACKKNLCAQCTASAFTQFFCTDCDALAVPWTVGRAERSLFHWLTDAITYPARRVVMIAFVALLVVGIARAAALFIAPAATDAGSAPADARAEAQRNLEEGRQFLESDSPDLDIRESQRARAAEQDEVPPLVVVSTWLRVGILLLFALTIVGGTATRPRAPPLPEWVLLVIKTALAVVIVVGPAVVYAIFLVGEPGQPPPWKDPMAWLFVCLAIPYLTIAIAAGATQRDVGEIVNPFKLWDWAWKIGRQYWLTVIIAAALGYAAFRLLATPPVIWPGRPVVDELLRTVLVVGLLAITARLFGLLAYVRGDAFGWGDIAMYRDPMFPQLKAEGTRKPPPEEPDDEDDAADARPAGPRDPVEVRQVRDIVAAIKDHNLVRALRLYEARESWSDDAIEDRELLALGRAAEVGKKLELARSLYRRVADNDSGRAPRALFLLAKTQDDPDQAAILYRELLDRFPSADVAKQVTKILDGVPSAAD